jgi:hypothetical protein
MSRYTIPSFDPNYEIIVGWDWPMRTYFAQVKDTRQAEGDEGFMRVWIGTSTTTSAQGDISRFRQLLECLIDDAPL